LSLISPIISTSELCSLKVLISFNLKHFAKHPSPIGNDGWLFFVGEEHDSYLGKRPLTSKELDDFKKELEYRKKYLEQRNCEFYLVVAPIKANIYPEKVPHHEYRSLKASWGEQLIQYLSENSDVKTINLYDLLRKKKSTRPLYYKLDNHWNQLGAFYAGNEILNQIHSDLPAIKSNLIEDFNIRQKDTCSGNLVEMISYIWDAKECFYEIKPKTGFEAKYVDTEGYPIVKGFPYPGEYEIDKEIKGSHQPKLLVVSDSFGASLFPFLAEQFSRSVKIFDNWEYKLNEEIVEAENPDVVILLCLESGIRGMLKHLSYKTQKK